MKDKCNKENIAVYPGKIAKFLKGGRFFGRMNDPTSSSYLKGPCGDAMEFYLVIENDKITDVRYYTEGCDSTNAAAATAAYLVYGKTISEALAVSAGDIIKKLKGFPERYLHCSILAVSALYRAIADYLLKK